MVERIGARSVQVGTEVPTEPAKTQEVPAEKDSFKPALVEKKSSGPIAEARTVLLGSSLSETTLAIALSTFRTLKSRLGQSPNAGQKKAFNLLVSDFSNKYPKVKGLETLTFL